MRPVYVPVASEAEERVRAGRRALYGETREDSDVWTPDRTDGYWTDEFRERVRADQDAVVLVWGKAGSGKSSCIIDRCRKHDETFTPATLPERVAFHARDVPNLYRRTPRYGAAWIDEAAAAGLLATDTHSGDQMDLVELMTFIRAKNVLLFVTIPDPSDLAKSFRARRADYRIETHRDGSDYYAFVGRRPEHRKTHLDDGRWLGFMDDDSANPLRWPDFRTATNRRLRAFWEAYAPLKFGFMDRRIDEIAEGMERRAQRKKVRGMGARSSDDNGG